MRDELVVLDGSSFVVSDASGDIGGVGCDGFFFADTRHLSKWQLFVDGSAIYPLCSGNVDYYSARVVGVIDGDEVGDRPTMTIQRDRIVSDGIHEDFSVENNSEVARKAVVELCYAADFADLFEIREPEIQKARDPKIVIGDMDVTIIHENEQFRRGTHLAFTVTGEITGDSVRFELDLQPRQRWSVCVDVSCIEGDEEHGPRAGHGGFGQLHPQMPMTLEEWIDDSPKLDTDVGSIARTYRQCLLDLAALRFRSTPDDKVTLPAAGLPWFMAVFGRDSLITSYMVLPFQPRLAAATLQVLAGMQATEDDPFRDAQPGKIPHELRRGELTVLGETPHFPYYGSHDATPLFLILLDEYERWTGDVGLVKQMESVARAALDWIEGPGDLDGDGYLEYRTRSTRGLVNQGWKDSPNAVLFADGRCAEPPIALCEIQGYAFDARRRMARLAREVWNDDDLADRLEADAAALAARFADDFWCEDRGHPALALDCDKQRVDSLTSNIGHLLWSGILDDEQAAQVAERLRGAELWTGWGVRSMSAADAGYNPIEYHNGTVWPQDCALIAEGLRRYGFREQASELAKAVFDAAAAFEHRLPEVFAGFDREATTLPANYPTASRPQAWSAAAPLLALRTIMGLDVVDGDLQAAPELPKGVNNLALRSVSVRGKRLDTT